MDENGTHAQRMEQVRAILDERAARHAAERPELRSMPKLPDTYQVQQWISEGVSEEGIVQRCNDAADKLEIWAMGFLAAKA